MKTEQSRCDNCRKTIYEPGYITPFHNKSGADLMGIQIWMPAPGCWLDFCKECAEKFTNAIYPLWSVRIDDHGNASWASND